MFPDDSEYFGIFVKKNLKGLQLDFDVTYITVAKSDYTVVRLFNYIVYFWKVLFFRCDENTIIYVHFPTRTLFPLLFRPKLNAKIILNFHGSDLIHDSSINWLLFRLQKRLYRRTEGVVVPSGYLKRIALVHFKEEQLFVSPSSGVPDNFFSAKKTLMGDELNIVYISTVNDEKGVFDLCEAIQKLSKSVPQVLLQIYGKVDTRYSSRLRSYLLSENIAYMGVIDNSSIPRVLESAYCFVFPSKKESLGLVGLEALATGTPVIGSDIPAIQTYIEDEFNGLIFECGNVDSLRQKLERLICDENLYGKVSANSKKSVYKFRQSYVVEELNNYIKKLIE
ncbi:MAG: glycosyltransferase family 4 protein [Bacteroidetes bacterium]|nr:glycosyltransferase family 4 protein [Bacteroidota bacterium]MDA1126860.1 glycosyltransferase family 4 protein [Bacteroidota bacterium]